MLAAEPVQLSIAAQRLAVAARHMVQKDLRCSVLLALAGLQLPLPQLLLLGQETSHKLGCHPLTLLQSLALERAAIRHRQRRWLCLSLCRRAGLTSQQQATSQISCCLAATPSP